MAHNKMNDIHSIMYFRGVNYSKQKRQFKETAENVGLRQPRNNDRISSQSAQTILDSFGISKPNGTEIATTIGLQTFDTYSLGVENQQQ